MLQDSDGEAGIALVGVHSDFPKYGAGPVDEKCPNSNGGATVGYDSDDNDDVMMTQAAHKHPLRVW